MSGKKLVIAAAGTGGHVMPGLAVAREMRRRGWEVQWIGTQTGMESGLVGRDGIEFTGLDFRGMRGRGLSGLISGAVKLVKSTFAAKKFFARVRPDVLFTTGGYIAGRKDLVELCAYRLNAPGLGKELGCTLETPRDMYLGFYYAPGVVCEAIKTAIYAQCMLELLGKNPVPRYCDDHNAIVTCFDAGTADALIGFCQGIQAASPVDSYAAPEPSPEPGYTDEVVMASGSFTQGSTIELSCDGPLREPYTCYLQGGLNFAASRAGVLLAIQKAYFKD